MSVGLALIARDEANRLPRLLKSIEGAFDQVVLVDTGSKDDTIGVFEQWARDEADRHPGFVGISGEGKWIDDFAAARRGAHRLLETDWEVWADCDDEIIGASVIRQLCEQAPPDLVAYVAGYDYGQDPVTGKCICYLRRERLVRRGHGQWYGRVHEAQAVDGPVQHVPDDVLLWKHGKSVGALSNKRNLRILRNWLKDEPDNPRILMYLGAEYMARGNFNYAIRFFRRYLRIKTTWDEERAQQHRRLSMCLMAQRNFDQAVKSAYEALHVKPSWPDSYLTLAQIAHMRDEHARAVEWADRCLALGVPETLLIINPFDYVYEPLKVKAASLAAMDRIEEAVEIGQRALELVPYDQELRNVWAGWRRRLEADKMAETFAQLTHYLVSRDEQLKAARLLECVPHDVSRHHLVNDARAAVYERVGPLLEDACEHYGTAGVNPAKPMTLEHGRQWAQTLPRAGFAVNGLLEQVAA